jgi:1-hydroxycarotenoid 3,4-desaturase
MADVKNFPLSYHNVFFDQDYPEEFNAIFSRQRLPAHPTVYICAQDRLTGRPVAGPERLLVLINAPANGDSKAWSERDLRLAASNAEHVLAGCGLRLDLSDSQASIGHPSEFHHLFPGSGGSLYGRASHGMLSSFTRPSARTRKPGLYLAGGSVHPGPGVPMATLSGRIAAHAALEDLRAS